MIDSTAEDGHPLLLVGRLQDEIVPTNVLEWFERLSRVAMTGKDHGAVGQRVEQSETVEHRLGIASGKIGTTAAVEEQGVPGHQCATNVETLTSRSVARRVDTFDLDPTDPHHVSAVVQHQMIGTHSGGLLDPRCLVAIHVNRNVDAFEEAGHTLDAVAHHRPAHVVGMVVSGENTGETHSVGGRDVDQLVDPVRRIDDDALTRGPIADQVHEVDHLVSQWIVGREVVSGQKLAEVEVVVGHRPYANPVSIERLTQLEPGQIVPFGGDRRAVVDAELAAAFRDGDRLVVVQESGDLLHVPGDVARLVESAVDEAVTAFRRLGTITVDRIDRFYGEFAARLGDDSVFAPVAEANGDDVADARRRDRAVGRLILSDKMRADMIAALHMWRDLPDPFAASTTTIEHDEWTVEERRSPLGVVGFVFEGRPNVFADATGVLKSGNSVVFRIGSDALRTARAIMAHCVRPALDAADLPAGSVVLVDSPARSAGHALFSDPRLALAVARGSGEAVAQLGAVARQAGIPVSLHGTGGAWIHVAEDVDSARVTDVVDASLDRKVCNTVNVVAVPRGRLDILRSVLEGVERAADRRGARAVVHMTETDRSIWADTDFLEKVSAVVHGDETFLATEWEWDDVPEVSVISVPHVERTLDLFDRHSPHFIVSVLTADERLIDYVYASTEAPFVGDGFTRWVDGQYALGRPELGLSNWQNGRLFGRGGILSGDGVYSIRYLSRHRDSRQRR